MTEGVCGMYKGLYAIDGHADILFRMGNERLPFYDPVSPLHQSYSHLMESGIDLQVFVTFNMPDVSANEQLLQVMDSLHRFHTEVYRPESIVVLRTRSDLQAHMKNPSRLAALLSLEGADALNGHLSVLHALFQMGVRLIGLTWNGANCVADGVGELRGGGLTAFGRETVAQMQELGMLVDVSHLAARGVWDVIEVTRKPVIASHSNALAVHRHRRNLTDDQIRAIAQTGGVVGATFVPAFVGDGTELGSEDVIRHIDHLIQVGGLEGVALGSDFDGIDHTLTDLRNGSDYPAFFEKLEARYGMEGLQRLIGGNLARVLSETLPE